MNLGEIGPTRGLIDINTGTFDNEGVVETVNYDLTIESGVATPNLSAGILTGGTWVTGGAVISFDTGPIATLDANVNILGTGAIEDGVMGVLRFRSGAIGTIER